jgi:hypothetical protein
MRNMMSYKKCLGCGVTLQSTNKDELGYVPDLNADGIYCKRCFRIDNYGDKVNNLTIFEIESYLEKLSSDEFETIMVIDALNPYDTLIPNINKYVQPSKLTLVVNKTDLFPRDINDERIIE